MGIPTYEEFLKRVKRDNQTEREERPEPPPREVPKESYSRTYPTEEYIRNIVQGRMEEVERRISEVHSQIRDLSTRLEAQQQIFVKIDDTRQEVKELSAKLKNLEKAFKDTLPSIVQSVRVIGELVNKIRNERDRSETRDRSEPVPKKKEKKTEDNSMYIYKPHPREQKVKTVEL